MKLQKQTAIFLLFHGTRGVLVCNLIFFLLAERVSGVYLKARLLIVIVSAYYVSIICVATGNG